MQHAKDTRAAPSLQYPLTPADALPLATRMFPRLCFDGVEPVSASRPIDPRQVQLVIDYIWSECQPAAERTVPILSSRLRLAAAWWSSSFISEGAAIVGAFACRLEVRPALRHNWPSAAICVQLPKRQGVKR